MSANNNCIDLFSVKRLFIVLCDILEKFLKRCLLAPVETSVRVYTGSYGNHRDVVYVRYLLTAVCCIFFLEYNVHFASVCLKQKVRFIYM